MSINIKARCLLSQHVSHIIFKYLNMLNPKLDKIRNGIRHISK
jgi:hypothetical protein